MLENSGSFHHSADPRSYKGVSCLVKLDLWLVAATELDRHAAQPQERVVYTTRNHTIVAWPG